MSRLMQLTGEVDARMRGGEALDKVEREVIEPSGLGEDERAALWLFGWAVADTGSPEPPHRPEPFFLRERG